MFGIDQLCNVSSDPNSLDEQLKPYLEETQRKLDALRLQQALDFLASISEDELNDLPVQDESRVDLSAPKNWHEGIDLIRHIAELGDPAEAGKLANVLAAALDAYPSIKQLTGATWALILLKMLDRAITVAPNMPSPPKN